MSKSTEIEAPDVVAFLMKPDTYEPYVGLRRDGSCDCVEPLMTVAQHERILRKAMLAKSSQVPAAELSKIYGTCWRGKQLRDIAPGTLLCAPVFRVESSAAMTCLIGTAVFPHGTKLYEVTAEPAPPAD